MYSSTILLAEDEEIVWETFMSRWEDNIMMGLKDKRFKTVDSRGSEGSSGDLL